VSSKKWQKQRKLSRNRKLSRQRARRNKFGFEVILMDYEDEEMDLGHDDDYDDDSDDDY
jgi:hypothetical protein